MYFKDLTDTEKKELEWVGELHHGSSAIEQYVNDAIGNAKDMTEIKSLIISYMVHTMAECSQVILHVNTMEAPTKCTCTENCGDK